MKYSGDNKTGKHFLVLAFNLHMNYDSHPWYECFELGFLMKYSGDNKKRGKSFLVLAFMNQKKIFHSVLNDEFHLDMNYEFHLDINYESHPWFELWFPSSFKLGFLMKYSGDNKKGEKAFLFLLLWIRREGG